MAFAVVNAEYEFELFKDLTGGTTPEKIRNVRVGREFLFYFINKDPSLTLINYFALSPESADYLQGLGLVMPAFASHGEGFNWYGKLTNLALERKLNSKLFCLEFLRDLGELPPETYVVNSKEEILKKVKTGIKKRWLLKSPFRQGGTGFFLIEKESDIPASLDHSHILCPFRERVLDFSLYHDPSTGETFSYITRMQPNGAYLGGIVHESEEHLRKDLEARKLIDQFDPAISKMRFYLDVLKKYPLDQPITLDGFLYREGDKISSCPLTEINYRISMGSLNSSLKRFLPPHGIGLLISLPPGSGDWKSASPYNHSSRTGIISLNDKNPQLEVVLLCAASSRKLDRYEHLVFQGI